MNRRTVLGMVLVFLIVGMMSQGLLVLDVQASDTIIDTHGDSRFTKYPSGGAYWWSRSDSGAYNGNFWYTYCGDAAHGGDLYWGKWDPPYGQYEVFVWIPNPTAFPGYVPTHSANYDIYHSGGLTEIAVNQALRLGGWYSLGSFTFVLGSMINLDDRTGEPYASTMVAFDAIKFTSIVPPRTLTVYSSHGSPVPSTGAHSYNDGQSVTCSVSSPVVDGGVSYSCTGWSGTGSVPSIGSSTSVTFSITQDSTITWNWIITPRTLTVTSAHDSPNPSNGQYTYNDHQSVTCSVTSPVTEGSTVWVCSGWSGTGSVPSSGSSTSVTFAITQDSTITWNWGTQTRTLTVSSAHDSPVPSVGAHSYSNGQSVTCSVTSPVVEGSVSYSCTGWSGSGSVPSSGSSTFVTFTITQDSSITWNWIVTPPEEVVFQPPFTFSSEYGSDDSGLAGKASHDEWTDLSTGSGKVEVRASATFAGTGIALAGISLGDMWTSEWSGQARVRAEFKATGVIMWSSLSFLAPYLLSGKALHGVTFKACLRIYDVDSSTEIWSKVLTIYNDVSEFQFLPSGKGDSVRYSDSQYAIQGFVNLNEGHTYSWHLEWEIKSMIWVVGAATAVASSNIITRIEDVRIDKLNLAPDPFPNTFVEGFTHVAIASPADLLFVDPEGRRVGFDTATQQEVNEIPGAWYSGHGIHPQYIAIPAFVTDNCEVLVIGSDEGSYTLAVLSGNSTNQGNATLEVLPFQSYDIPISANSENLYTFNWTALSHGEEGVAVEVDSDGNGIAEYSFTSDSELNRSEYVAATTQHDIEVTEMTISKGIIAQGYSLVINSTVMNYGVYAEVFNITSYANTTIIASQTIVLASGNFTTVLFTLDTSSFAKGNYTISVIADPVPGETFTADNTLIYGEVTITIPGDVNGDFFVNIMDATQIGLYWLQAVPLVPANVDINGDGIINVMDATLVGLNWLKHA